MQGIRRKFLAMLVKKIVNLYLFKTAEMRKLIIVKKYLLHVWKW